MKKIFVFALIAVFVLGSFNSCKNSEKKDKKEVVKIGAILPLTGNGSTLGKGYQNAMKLALNFIDSTSSVKHEIKILFEDSQSKSNIAVNAANKLVKTNNIDLLILANANVVESVKPIAIKNKIPVIAITSTPDITKKSDLIYRVWLNEQSQIEKLSNYIISNNYHQIGIFAINNEYGENVSNLLNKLIGERIKYETKYSINTMDFKNEVAKLKDLNLDAIYILGNPPDYISLIRKFREFGYEADILGTSALTVSFVLNDLNNLMDNIVFTGPSILVENKNIENPYSNYFKNNFKRISKSEPEWFYGFCFDQIIFIYEALKKMQKSKLISLNDALKSVHVFQGVNGKIVMDKTGDSYSDIVILKYIDGKFSKVQ